MNVSQVFTLLLLVIVANAAPLLISRLMGQKWNAPVDGGLVLPDRQPLLGPSKTIRGLLASMLATAVLAALLGFSPLAGLGFASLAMLGDACSSFIKRRLKIASRHSAPLLDQLPESLLPLWIMQPVLGGGAAEILTAAAIFTLIDLALSRMNGSGHAL